MVTVVDSVRDLGVITDSQLCMDAQVAALSTSCGNTHELGLVCVCRQQFTQLVAALVTGRISQIRLHHDAGPIGEHELY